MKLAIEIGQQDCPATYLYARHLARRKFIQTRHFNIVFVGQRLSSFSLVPNPKDAAPPVKSPHLTHFIHENLFAARRIEGILL